MTVTHKQKITIKPLGKHTGAEVIGLDLRQPIDDETKKELNAAIVQWCCLVFPEQNLSPEQYLGAVSIFGEPVEQNYSAYHLDGNPLINTVSNHHPGKDGKEKAYHATYWHTDFPDRELPPNFSALYSLKLPDSGGETGVVNMRAAFEALPQDFKDKIDNRKAYTVRRASKASDIAVKHIKDEDEKYLSIKLMQPLVRTHPVNGSKAIYFHQGKVETIEGYTTEESRALVQEILETAIKPEFIYKHPWKVGDMMIWDNRATMHRGYPNFDLEQHRLLYRVIAGNEKAF
jgi:taurine dioxygenase